MSSSRADRKRKESSNPGAPPASIEAPAPRRRWLLLLVCVVAAAVGSWALFEYVIWTRVPAELVGKWVVMEGPDEGGTIDFFRTGSMVAVVNLGGKQGIIDAAIQVDGNRIIATVKNKATGELGTRTQTFKFLDERHLILEDERGVKIKLERAQ